MFSVTPDEQSNKDLPEKQRGTSQYAQRLGQSTLLPAFDENLKKIAHLLKYKNTL
jgi:hypothetical protein